MSRDPTIEFYHRESEAQRAEIARLREEIVILHRIVEKQATQERKNRAYPVDT